MLATPQSYVSHSTQQQIFKGEYKKTPNLCFSFACASGGGACQHQASADGASAAENQRGQSQVPVSEEGTGTNQTAPDAGTTQMDR